MMDVSPECSITDSKREISYCNDEYLRILHRQITRPPPAMMNCKSAIEMSSHGDFIESISKEVQMKTLDMHPEARYEPKEMQTHDQDQHTPVDKLQQSIQCSISTELPFPVNAVPKPQNQQPQNNLKLLKRSILSLYWKWNHVDEAHPREHWSKGRDSYGLGQRCSKNVNDDSESDTDEDYEFMGSCFLIGPRLAVTAAHHLISSDDSNKADCGNRRRAKKRNRGEGGNTSLSSGSGKKSQRKIYFLNANQQSQRNQYHSHLRHLRLFPLLDMEGQREEAEFVCTVSHAIADPNGTDLLFLWLNISFDNGNAKHSEAKVVHPPRASAHPLFLELRAAPVVGRHVACVYVATHFPHQQHVITPGRIVGFVSEHGDEKYKKNVKNVARAQEEGSSNCTPIFGQVDSTVTRKGCSGAPMVEVIPMQSGSLHGEHEPGGLSSSAIGLHIGIADGEQSVIKRRVSEFVTSQTMIEFCKIYGIDPSSPSPPPCVTDKGGVRWLSSS